MSTPADSPLRDAVCIVTGGGSGIGRALCRLLASEGAKVVVVGRTESKLKAVQAEIEASGGVALARVVDVVDPNATRAMVEGLLRELGRIDVLVNNAGHSSRHRRLMSTTPDEIRSVLGTNLTGTMLCTQAVVPSMRAAGKGTIVNVSSLAAEEPGFLGGMAYGAAKAGVVNFTRFLASELRNSGIRACVVLPGEADTPILDERSTPPSREARGTMLTAEDVAATIAFVLRLPARATISELIIRPTMRRDMEPELEPA